MKSIRKTQEIVPVQMEIPFLGLTTAFYIRKEQKHASIDTLPIQNQKQHTEAKKKTERLVGKQRHSKMPKVQGQHEDSMTYSVEAISRCEWQKYQMC